MCPFFSDNDPTASARFPFSNSVCLSITDEFRFRLTGLFVIVSPLTIRRFFPPTFLYPRFLQILEFCDLDPFGPLTPIYDV